MNPSVAASLARIQRGALVVGVAGAGVCLLGLVMHGPADFFRAYLTSYLYVLGPALGSLAIVMLHNMTGGEWGFAVRRLLEAAMRTLPLAALFFVPIALGMRQIYEWTHDDVVAADAVLQHKAPYLNVPFFLGRAVFYFALWALLARTMVRLAERYDRKLSLKALRRLKSFSGFGLVLYVLSMSFASFDWAMSLEPHWFSTIYGVHFIVGQTLTTLCFAILAAAFLARHEPFSRWIGPRHFHDLGNLTLAFVMLWAYVSFSQFLIIWSGNLPEEVPWYLTRLGPAWQVVALVLVVAHFAAPFVVLLMRASKQKARVLAQLAGALLVVRYLDYYWLVAPAFHEGEFQPHWLDLAVPVTLGALWLAAFVHYLHGRPLVSLQDARLLGQLEAPAP